MKNKFIANKDIITGKEDVFETVDKKLSAVDPGIAQDLVTIFQIKEIHSKMNNFIETQSNKIDALERQLNYSYDKLGKRVDSGYTKNASKNILENIKWKEEINIVIEQEKINILKYIAQKGLVIDKIKFIGEQDLTVTCLGVAIGSVDIGDDEDEDPCVLINAEFVLNVAGGIETPIEDDTAWEINIDEIKELIVDNTKYIFLL